MKKVHAGILLALAVILASVVTVTALATSAHFSYKDRVVPHVFVAGIDLSGLDSLAAISTLQRAYDDMISRGIDLTVDGNTETVPLFATGDGTDVAYNLIEWDPAAAAHQALQVGHAEHPIVDSLLVLSYQLFQQKEYAATVTVNDARLREAILAAFPDEQITGTPTDYRVSISSKNGINVTVVPGTAGRTLAIDTLLHRMPDIAHDLTITPLTISTLAITPDVSEEEAETLIDAVKIAVAKAPYTLTGMTIENEPASWEMSQRTIADWILPQRNETGDIVLSLDATKMIDMLTELHIAIDVSAKNARFTITDGKVSEFEASANGIVVDDAMVYNTLLAALTSEDNVASFPVATLVDTPSIPTPNTNALGITEILGEATTSFPHSTDGRRANIRHGAEKLNGLLIAPGEIISVEAFLKPFTIADGYVPELVIKGDEIKPEVGGGLCQLGTTAFRAVMNSGLEVIERRNHSLAISYYNDINNGNPGTDATIYDPAPDFKFKNTFSTNILLITTFHEEDSTITFTFWGTSDGRKGSYAPPTVLTRIPVGATQYKTTTDLAPGVEQCQNAFPGYTTTFDYTITYADGTKTVTPFFSSYRALPRICLVGASSSTQ
jgi:vancomycin resistance protein YoaR